MSFPYCNKGRNRSGEPMERYYMSNQPALACQQAADADPAAVPAVWRRLQSILLLGGIALVGLLVVYPTLGVTILWNILIPAAPALLVVVPGLWRNICPMATFSLLPRHLGISRKKIIDRRWVGYLEIASIAALLLIVPLRHLSLNTNGPMSALMLVAAALCAFAMGCLFEWRSGWCTSLCPIHPVEKLYGFSPAASFANARCQSCRKCTVPCPDSTRSMTPVVTGPSRFEKLSGHGFVGGFPGFIWGWFQLPDLSRPLVLADIIDAYAWPWAGAFISLGLYIMAHVWLFRGKAAQAKLTAGFATAAVSTYYWYRIPALVGFGPNPGSGMLFDLSGYLPDWLPMLSHAVTTTFFIWFLLLRPNARSSWMTRPPYAE